MICGDEALHEWRISSWRDKVILNGYGFSGDPRNSKKTKPPVVELGELGKKLSGVERW